MSFPVPEKNFYFPTFYGHLYFAGSHPRAVQCLDDDNGGDVWKLRPFNFIYCPTGRDTDIFPIKASVINQLPTLLKVSSIHPYVKDVGDN